jgi:ketosteroid isomerase-like protein
VRYDKSRGEVEEMTEHANAVLARRGYAAFTAGDMDTLRDLMAEGAIWHQPGKAAIAGDFIGRDQVFEYFGKLFELSGGTFKADPEDILADDDRAVVVQHTTGTRDGKTLDAHHVLVFEIRGGKFAETRVYAADQEGDDAFWS